MDEREFPANSKYSKPGEPKKVEGKKVERVVTGKVQRRKKPLGRRFAETFVAGEADSVGRYVLFDVIIPAIKDIIADVVSQGIEKMLYGEARSTSRRTGYRPGAAHVSYNRYSSSPPWNRDRDKREESRPISRRSRASHDFDEIVLATRAEAEEVLSQLFELVSKYEQATVSDLYNMVGITPAFTDEAWGWTDIRGVGAVRVSNGYLLDLPKPEPLD
jgi:hypothetical protein